MPEQQIFTEREACKYLNISASTLWRERQARRISYHRLGGSIRYTLDDLRDYLARNRQPAVTTRSVR